MPRVSGFVSLVVMLGFGLLALGALNLYFKKSHLL